MSSLAAEEPTEGQPQVVPRVVVDPRHHVWCSAGEDNEPVWLRKNDPPMPYMIDTTFDDVCFDSLIDHRPRYILFMRQNRQPPSPLQSPLIMEEEDVRAAVATTVNM